MSDNVTSDRINQLADEEHALRAKEADGSATDADRARVKQIEVELDRCWDLLRQRKARSEFGENPDDAEPRSTSTVEGYLQ